MDDETEQAPKTSMDSDWHKLLKDHQEDCFRKRMLDALAGPESTITIEDTTTGVTGTEEGRCCSACTPSQLAPDGPFIAYDRLGGIRQARTSQDFAEGEIPFLYRQISPLQCGIL
jgi:hypothetical protein